MCLHFVLIQAVELVMSKPTSQSSELVGKGPGESTALLLEPAARQRLHRTMETPSWAGASSLSGWPFGKLTDVLCTARVRHWGPTREKMQAAGSSFYCGHSRHLHRGSIRPGDSGATRGRNGGWDTVCLCPLQPSRRGPGLRARTLSMLHSLTDVYQELTMISYYG